MDKRPGKNIFKMLRENNFELKFYTLPIITQYWGQKKDISIEE